MRPYKCFQCAYSNSTEYGEPYCAYLDDYPDARHCKFKQRYDDDED